MEEVILDETTGEFITLIAEREGEPGRLTSNIRMQDVLDESTGEFRRVAVEVEEIDVQKKTVKPRVNTRKRTRNQENWVRNIRRVRHQSGKEYVSVRGKAVPARSTKNKKDCISACKYGCSRFITDDMREYIHKQYYELSQNEKYHFIMSTTEKVPNKRSTCNSDRKKYSYIFFFNVKGNSIKVCKTFYLTTLDISQKTVYGVHNRKDEVTGVPASDRRGKHKNHKCVDDARKILVRQHIESFPVIDSHYCRSTTKRRYLLESLLSLNKMYELYIEFCHEISEQPVKKSMYSKIFNEEYNFGFHIPKKDRCDLCEEYNMSKSENRETTELKEQYDRHVTEKNNMRQIRQQDREEKIPVLCFDLENIITCPRAEISCFFYLSKLNVYNLTAHFSKTKVVYCAIWNETFAGKSGNDLASGVRKILEAVFDDNPGLKQLTLWCDSCVPQNRNQMISFAILDFLKENEHIDFIEIKYSTPGHSAVQEIDSVHSCIDRVLTAAEFYSPLSFIKLLKKVDTKKPYKILQMNKNDIMDYANCSKNLEYSNVPYKQVTALKFTQCYFTLFYKTSHGMTDWLRANLLRASMASSTRRRTNTRVITFPRDIPTPTPVRERKKLAANKVKAIKEMMKWMPKVDQEYFNALLREVDAT